MHKMINRTRDEAGATTAEYAVVTGCGVTFGTGLYKFLTSEWGQTFLNGVFSKILGMLPF